MTITECQYRRDILHYLREFPSRTSEQIAAALQKPHIHVITTLPSMYKEGLVTRNGSPGKFRYSVGTRMLAKATAGNNSSILFKFLTQKIAS